MTEQLEEILGQLPGPCSVDLSSLRSICVERYVGDAASAIRDGAVLLAVSIVNNDHEGDGFRLLLGLPKGVRVSPSLGRDFGVAYD